MRRFKRRKRRVLLLISVLAVLGSALGALIVARGVYRWHRAQVAREAGMAAYARGEYETALKNLRYPLLRNRNDIEVLLAFADSRSQVFEVNNAHLKEAMQLYSEVLRQDADNAEAPSALLGLYGRLGFYTEWADIADRILVQSPDNIDALSVKATVAYRSGRYDEVIELTRRLSEFQPQELSWRAKYIAAARASGERDQAILLTIDEWIQAHEEDGRFRLIKAQFLVWTGDVQSARQELGVAAGLGADSLSVLEPMLNLLEALDLSTESEQLLTAAKAKFPEQEWVYEASVRRLWRSARLEEALVEIEQAQEALGRLDRQLFRWKALVHASRGEKVQAREALDALQGQADGSPNAEADRAWVEAVSAGLDSDERKWTDTVTVHERAVAMHPDDKPLRLLLAKTYQSIGEHDLAVAQLQHVVRVDPGWVAAQIALAESLLTVGRASEAFEVLAREIQRHPNAGSQAYRLFVQAWIESGDAAAHARASVQVGLIDFLQQLHAERERDPEITAWLAEAYVREGMIDDAVALIDRVRANDDTDARTLRLLAEVSLRWNLGREESLLAQGDAAGDSSLDLAATRAQVLARDGRLEEALELIDAAVAGTPDPRQAEIETRPLRVELMLSQGGPGAIKEMDQWLRSATDPRVAASFVLDHEQAWDNPELIQHAIDVLDDHVGEDAPQVKLARASFSRRFHADDPQKIASAVALVGDVMQRTPESKQALTLMASLLLLSRNPPYDEVIGHLKRAVDLYPSDGTLCPQLIALLQRRGEFDTADRYLSRLNDLAKVDPRLRPVELELLKRQGAFEQAVAHLSEWVDTSSPEAIQIEHAGLLATVGRYADAEAIYERLLQSPGYGRAAAVAAADFFAATGRFERGLEILVGLEIDPGPKEVVMAGFYHRYGFETEAADHLRRAVERGPKQPDLWAAIANLHLSRREVEEARQATLKGLQLAPDEPELQTLLALISMSSGEADRRDAIAMLEGLESSHPGLLPTVSLYDRIVGRDDGAEVSAQDLRDSRQLVIDYPVFLPAWRVAINLHVQADRVDEAIHLARQATGMLPAEPEPARLACTLLMTVHRTDEALSMARLWRQRSPEDPLPVVVTIAALLLDLDRPAEAVRQIEGYTDRIWAQREQFPSRIEVWLGALLASGDVEEASRLTGALIAESKPWHERCLQIASRLGQDSAQELISLLEPALMEEPAGRLQLADAWASVGRRFDDETAYARADALTATIPADPTHSARVTLLRADLAMRRGDLTLAQEHYRSILLRDSTDVAALNNLADVLVRQRARCDESVDLARRAATLTGGNPSVLDTLAQALLCRGQYNEAERQIRAALDQQPRKPSFLVTLTGVLHAQRRATDAAVALNDAKQALASVKWPDPDLLRRIGALTDTIQSSDTSEMFNKSEN